MTKKRLDALAQHLIEILPKLKEDQSQMGKEFCETAEAYIRTSKQLYKIIEISDKNQSAIMDMSKELKKSRKELQKAKEHAEQANRSKSIFLSNMSHEIRTPLNSIIGFTELLQNMSLEGTQKQYLENVNVSAHSLLGIINDILDFSKIEAGKLELEVIMADIIKVTENSLNIVKFQAQDKGLSLVKVVQPDIPRFALIDTVRLRQVLINLLGNAIKFTEKGEVKLELSFDRVDESRGKYHFCVQDTGIGISEEKRKNLFKAFSQADVSITRKFGGSGLGLAISAMLVKKMGNCIKVDSEPGKGSKFYFSIETTCSSEDVKVESFQDVKSENESKDEVLTSTIMIAEDVNINMQLIKAIVGKYFPSCTILTAQNGEQAYHLTQTNDIDLILMDVQMPVMNGLDATKKIREDESITGQHKPIIALTAAAVKEDIQNCFDAGMDDYLTKPIKQKLFHEKIDKYLRQQHDHQKKKRTKDVKNSLQIDGVNCEQGLKRLNQNKDLYVKLLCEYAEQSTKDLEELKRALSEGSQEAIAIAHRIKGLAYNLSINEVGKTAEDIEQALKDDNIKTADTKVDTLKEKVQSFKCSIDTYKTTTNA